MPIDVVAPPGSGVPTGAAGGDLSGNFPNPGVAGVGGSPLTATAAEINVLHSVVAGTNRASSALVVDANKALDKLVTAALWLGATTGTLVTATAAELNVLHSVVAGTARASSALVVDSNKRTDVLVVGSLSLGAAAGTAITSTAAEINALASQGAVTTDIAKLHAITAAAADINATVAEASYAAGAAGRIQAAQLFR